MNKLETALEYIKKAIENHFPLVLLLPTENVSPEEATGIIDGASTALAFFSDQVDIKKGQKVLINGASGSIGKAAIQLAKQFGAEVTGVCSTKNKALVRDLGADNVLDYTKNELQKSSETFDVIFDTVGKLSYSKTNLNYSDFSKNEYNL